jgi:hypothetical protein
MLIRPKWYVKNALWEETNLIFEPEWRLTRVDVMGLQKGRWESLLMMEGSLCTTVLEVRESERMPDAACFPILSYSLCLLAPACCHLSVRFCVIDTYVHTHAHSSTSAMEEAERVLDAVGYPLMDDYLDFEGIIFHPPISFCHL